MHQEATRTLGMVVAGFLVHGWLIYTYHIQIVCSLLGILCIWGIKEPSIKMKKEESPTVLQIIQTVYQLFRKQSRLFYQMLMVQVMLTLITMYYFYYGRLRNTFALLVMTSPTSPFPLVTAF